MIPFSFNYIYNVKPQRFGAFYFLTRFYSQNYDIHNSDLQKLEVTNIYTFDNPLTQRKEIIKLIKNCIGVYIWTNKLNNHQYVGSSKILHTRISAYFMPSIISKQSRYIERAFHRYKIINFTLTVYTLNLGINNDISHINLEQYFITKLNPKYNILKIAGSTPNYIRTDNHKENLRLARGEKIYIYFGHKETEPTLLYTFLSRTLIYQQLKIHHVTLNNCLKNNILYLDHFLIQSELINKDNNINTLSLEQLQEIVDKVKVSYIDKVNQTKIHPKSQSVQVSNLNNPEEILKFASLTKAAKYYNIDKSTIKNYINTGKLYNNQWLFKFN